MATILDEIIAFKREEVAKIKSQIPLKKLVASPYFKRMPLSLKAALTALNSMGIIAEFKRKSPSKGIINDKAAVESVTQGYLSAGVAAQSILTDTHYFGGAITDLIAARNVQQTHPILRKDFIVDAFQIVEAKAIGADVILLIVASLTARAIKNFTQLAQDLGLEVLYEIHEESELEKIPDIDGKIIGVNNRDLKTFKVNWEHGIAVADCIPDICVKVAESGISDPKLIKTFRNAGFDGFLIGEHFMKTADPALAAAQFIAQIKI